MMSHCSAGNLPCLSSNLPACLCPTSLQIFLLQVPSLCQENLPLVRALSCQVLVYRVLKEPWFRSCMELADQAKKYYHLPRPRDVQAKTCRRQMAPLVITPSWSWPGQCFLYHVQGSTVIAQVLGSAESAAPLHTWSWSWAELNCISDAGGSHVRQGWLVWPSRWPGRKHMCSRKWSALPGTMMLLGRRLHTIQGCSLALMLLSLVSLV